MATSGLSKLPELPERVRPQDAVLLFDGLCGFCDSTVRWLLRHDRAGRIYFAAQQTELAQGILAHYGHAQGGDRAYLLIHPGTEGEDLLEGSAAILWALAMLDGVWRFVAAVLRVFPAGLENAIYAAVARNRYWIAGKRTECRVPTVEERARFLGL